jgi:hypothetical protein
MDGDFSMTGFITLGYDGSATGVLTGGCGAGNFFPKMLFKTLLNISIKSMMFTSVHIAAKK